MHYAFTLQDTFDTAWGVNKRYCEARRVGEDHFVARVALDGDKPLPNEEAFNEMIEWGSDVREEEKWAAAFALSEIVFYDFTDSYDDDGCMQYTIDG